MWFVLLSLLTVSFARGGAKLALGGWEFLPLRVKHYLFMNI